MELHPGPPLSHTTSLLELGRLVCGLCLTSQKKSEPSLLLSSSTEIVGKNPEYISSIYDKNK
jgi:hypothetical protein